jgi:hypothetical protein
MPTPSLGSPVTAFVDGIRAILLADATLTGMVTGIFGHMTGAQRTAYPYLFIGRRHRANDTGAMGVVGGHVRVQIDGWSAALGPSQIQLIFSRVAVLLERRPVTVTGFALVTGSMSLEFEDFFDEPDPSRPDGRLYRGVQQWIAEIHDA